jgi:hypothetical protein
MWAYTPTDAGDLALAQNDRIVVLEHMNDDCTLGRCDFEEDSRANMFMQGGVVAMSVQARRVSSQRAM